jgi:ubiquinone/menaquinone biosynthesis C-methylase UbiE
MKIMYTPENYWNNVAREISNRNVGNLIAGDDEPYYRYKRTVFLKTFKTLPFSGKKIMELGCGPGGNLVEASSYNPLELWGIDVSGEMLTLAGKQTEGLPVRTKKTDGLTIDFPDNYFNLSYTATVLQHNTNEESLKKLIQELCRVTKEDVYIFERIENRIKGHESNLGRPVLYYEKLFVEGGFSLNRTKPIATPLSYYTCGVIRKLFNSRTRKEGEKPSGISVFLQSTTLPVTSFFDKIIPTKRDLTMLHFKKK